MCLERFNRFVVLLSIVSGLVRGREIGMLISLILLFNEVKKMTLIPITESTSFVYIIYSSLNQSFSLSSTSPL